ncbi:RhuM family protein [Anaerovibrio sp.]|uniref:RhuM family protein n=1 Tax=Anaerovibrio sp. TaxID=1872532 RepID=UPI00388F00BA
MFFFFDDAVADNIIIYNTDDGKTNVKLYADDGTVWATQKAIADLFCKNVSTISRHINSILSEGELNEKSNLRKMQIANSDKPVMIYSLEVILAVGFRVRSTRGTQFRKWANTTLKEYLQKGFVLDKDRLKNPDGRPDYFDELLEQIRDIRASEKRFYQKLRDLFALSVDYDKTNKDTNMFFAEVQNKLLYGVTGMAAADIVLARADATKENMALTSWSGTRVRKVDVIIAKNYLTADEIDYLNRLVTIFLETAELRAKQNHTLTLSYWRNTVDGLLTSNGVPLLIGKGKHSAEDMKKTVFEIYADFDNRRKKYEAEQADKDDLAELDAALTKLK